MISFNMDDSFDPIFDFSINPETSLDMDSYYSCDIDDDEFAFDDEYDLDDLEEDALQEDEMNSEDEDWDDDWADVDDAHMYDDSVDLD